MRIKLLAGLLAGALPLAASATPIAGVFTGTVTQVAESGASVPGGIGVGATVTGTFQFENSGQSPYLVLGGGVDESRYFSSTPGSLLSISIGSDTWEAAGLSISARNDSTTFNQDMLQFAYTTNFSLIDNALPPPTSFPGVSPGLLNSSFGFSLFDDSQNMLSSQDLPGSAADINLVSTSLRNGSIFGNADGQNAFWNINFDVSSISLRDVPTEVPEPDTLSLMAAGLLAAGLLVRRRRPQAGLGTG